MQRTLPGNITETLALSLSTRKIDVSGRKCRLVHRTWLCQALDNGAQGVGGGHCVDALSVAAVRAADRLPVLRALQHVHSH